MAGNECSKNWETALRPEQQIVLSCARAAINSAATESIRVLVRSGLNWPDLLGYAARHHLSPIVYEVIADVAPDPLSVAHGCGLALEGLLPVETLHPLRRAAESSTVRGMALLQELLRLHRLFETAQIQVIPYKGPVLAWIAYGSFVRREYSDLDFAIGQKFIPDVIAVLKTAGYSLLFDPREAHARQNGFAPGQYSFLLDPQGFLVELHTERTLRYFPNPLDFQDLNDRLTEVEISGQRIRTFSIEDTLVLLCVHGAKHFWERIAWVLDIAKLATLRAVDWTKLHEIAAKMDSSRLLRLGLFLAHDLLAAPLPERFQEEICRDRAVRELAERIYGQYAGISDPGAGIFSRGLFRIRSRDGIGKGLRYALRLAMSPTESDRQTLHLPQWLAPVYVLVRPWRLVREHGLSSKRR